MSTMYAKVVLDSAGAQAGLDKFNDKLKKTTDGLGKINSLLGGLAIGAFVKSAFDLADAMADIAEATEMSIAAVSGFSKAVSQSGGSAEGAQKSLLKFMETISDAAKGSGELQNAFFEVGVSLSDLKKLSSEDLLKKTIDGLTKITDVNARLRLQTDLLGKGFKGVNSGGVASTYEAQKKASEAYEAASKRAAAAVDKFNDSVKTMKDQVIVALTPVIEAFNNLPTKQITTITKLVVELGLVFSVFKAGQFVFSSFNTLLAASVGLLTRSTKSFKTLSSAVSDGKGGIVTLTDTWSRLGYQMSAVKKDFAAGNLTMDVLANKTLPILGTRLSFATKGFVALGKGIAVAVGGAIVGVGSLVAGFALLVAQILLVNDAISALTGFDFIDTMAKKLENFVKGTFPSLHKAIDDLGKKMGMPDINGKPQSASPSTDAATEKAKERAAIERDLVDAADKQRLEMQKVVSNYVEANAQAAKRYQLETDMIGKSQEMQAIMQLRNEKEIDYLNQKKTIQEKIDQISRSNNPLEKATLLPDLNREMQALTAEYDKQTAAIEGQVKARMAADAANQRQLFVDQQRVALNQSIKSLLTEAATTSLPEIDKQYANIKASAEAAAKAQIASEEARRGAKLDKSEIEEYYKIALAGVEELYQAQLKLNAAQNKERLEKFGLQQEIDSSNELLKIQDSIAKMTMPEIEQKYYDIAAAARDSAKAAVDAEEARRGTKLDPAEAQAYYDKAYAGVNKLVSATKKQWEMSRSFETGWKNAMNSYIDEATNAAQKAEKLFTTAFKGMEDAIVNFAKTGKFEWKSFVSDMLEQLLRSQVQNVFANLMGSVSNLVSGSNSSNAITGSSGDSGIMGMIGSLLGGSNSSTSFGGQGSPVYVTNWPSGAGAMSSGSGLLGGLLGGGSNDTSLWDSVMSMFSDSTASYGNIDTSRGSGFDTSMWGNSSSSDSSGGWLSSVADSIGGIADSIGDWFGGFFADGGRIPAGKIGIVGERGPEIAGGPLNISPISGGGGSNVTNVYYTIQASDPQSFQQQLARDPSFVHGLVMQANKGLGL